MRIWSALFLGCILLCVSNPARADEVAVSELIAGKQTLLILDPDQYNSGIPDPRIRVKRLKRGSKWFYGLDFSFSLNDGTGDADFYNADSPTLYTLTLTITPDQPGTDVPELFSCGSDSELAGLTPFTNCRFLEAGGPDSATVVEFYGGMGLPDHSHFLIELDGFPSGVQVSAAGGGTPTSIPEPTSVVLFLAGAAWVVGRSKSRQSHSA